MSYYSLVYKKIWIFQLKYGQLYFLICTLMIWLRFLQPVNCSITCQDKMIYLLGKRKMLRNYLKTSGRYYDLLVNFSDMIWLHLEKYDINENNLRLAKSVIMNKLFYSILLFRVWNHLFLCERCQHSSWMCNFCTMMQIKHRRISNYINKNLYIQLNGNTPP